MGCCVRAPSVERRKKLWNASPGHPSFVFFSSIVLYSGKSAHLWPRPPEPRPPTLPHPYLSIDEPRSPARGVRSGRWGSRRHRPETRLRIDQNNNPRSQSFYCLPLFVGITPIASVEQGRRAPNFWTRMLELKLAGTVSLRPCMPSPISISPPR